MGFSVSSTRLQGVWMEKALDARQQTVPSGCLQEAVERKGWQQHLHSPALPRLTCKEVQRAGVPASLVSEDLQGREKIPFWALSGLYSHLTVVPGFGVDNKMPLFP